MSKNNGASAPSKIPRTRHVGAGVPLSRLPRFDQQFPSNPLTDDGDAFRLAVKLGIGLAGSGSHVWACILDVCDIHEPRGNDSCAAMRRAIVRAAAALAKP